MSSGKAGGERERAVVRIGIVGGGRGGTALLERLQRSGLAAVAVVVDRRAEAPALGRARELGIPTHHDPLAVFRYPVDLVLEVTGDSAVLEALLAKRPRGVEVLGAGGLRLFWDLVEREHRLGRRMAAILEAAQRCVAADAPGRVFEVLLEAAAQALHAQGAFLRLLEDGRLRLRASWGLPPSGVPEEVLLESANGWAVREGRVATVEDVERDGRISAASRRAFQELGVRSALAVPLRGATGATGALILCSREPRRFAAEEVQALQGFADLAAGVLARQQLLDEAHRRLDEAEALASAARAIGASLELDGVLEGLTEAAQRLTAGDAAMLALLDPVAGEMRFRVLRGHRTRAFEGLRVRPGRGIGGLVLETGRPVRTDDYANDPRITKDYLAPTRAEGFVAELAVPIAVAERPEGVLFVARRSARPFTDRDEAALLRLAEHAGAAIQNARLYAHATARAEALRALGVLTRALLGAADPAEILRLTVEHTLGLLAGARYARLWLWDAQAEVLRPGASAGIAPEVERAATDVAQIAPGQGVVGAVAQAAGPLFIPDVLADPRWINRRLAEAAGCQVYVGVPLRADGRLLGVLSVLCAPRPALSAEEQELLSLLADHAALVLDRARLVDELQRTLRDLRASQDRQLQAERLRALGEMAAGVAHDFNNLLAVILGRAELLLARTPEPARMRELEAIRRAALDGAETVRRIQEFTGTRQGRPAGCVDLRAVLEDVVEFARPRWEREAQSRGVRYEVVIDGDARPRVRGHAGELREVFLNLLWNALEAMPGGGRVTFRIRQGDAEALVSAEDTGCGMSEETRRRVFEPFFTTKGARGSGLGLSVAWGIVQRHGGTIGVDSAPGRGSTFTVRLPLAPDEPVPAPPPAVPRRQGSARILLVEDEEEVRAVLVDALEAAGYTVVAAQNGRDALALLEDTRPDLVLTDLSMPELSGWELIRAVGARWPDLPVACITGWGESVDPARAERERLRFVLTKPVAIQDLLDAVTRALPAP